MSSEHRSHTASWSLILCALGVVYGDIGTSPLYAIRECFHSSHAIALTEANILGILSLIFWSLVLIISVKYCALVLRADNNGEGGVLALMALAGRRNPRKIKASIVFCGLIGAALLYGDGVITPAISVLSAVEGLKIITPALDSYILPLTILILIPVFYFQKHGSTTIGKIFGPVIILWFISLAILGTSKVLVHPSVLAAVNPWYAVNFFIQNKWAGFTALGGVFLTVTGGESLYADMGHFGRRAIRYGWFGLAMPSLLLNYFGQGALLLESPGAIENPFYMLAPAWARVPLLILATCAAVIASQAVISSAFSMTRQAVQLGYLPRLAIRHTSMMEIGQVYVAATNSALFILTIWLVLEFKTSDALAAAYGVAVSGTMLITTMLVFFVMRDRWSWKPATAFILTALIFTIDLVFFSANIMKVPEGGWAPLVLAAVIFTVMTTWRRGRTILTSRLSEVLVPLDELMAGVVKLPPLCIPGTAIFMCRDNTKAPPSLIHNVKHNKILHEQVILLTINIAGIPIVPQNERMEVETLRRNFCRITMKFGFMEDPNIPQVLKSSEQTKELIDFENTTYFLGRETLFATERPGMALWREKLFVFMARNSHPATNYYHIPKDRVVELGIQVEL